MNIQDYDTRPFNSWKSIYDSLEQLEPAFEELEEGEVTTGDIRGLMSMKGEDHPDTGRINTALGFLAYTGGMKLLDHAIHSKSSSSINEFYAQEGIREHYDNVVDYLDMNVSEVNAQITKDSTNAEYDFGLEFDPSVDYTG